ncbi:hypothetical protein V8F20_010176 [Naviculisporaceae sp. PSN 640]
MEKEVALVCPWLCAVMWYSPRTVYLVSKILDGIPILLKPSWWSLYGLISQVWLPFLCRMIRYV